MISHKCIIRYALSEKKPQYGVEELRVFVISIGRWEKSPMPINYEMIISPNIDGPAQQQHKLDFESFIISQREYRHVEFAFAMIIKKIANQLSSKLIVFSKKIIMKLSLEKTSQNPIYQLSIFWIYF